MTEPDITVEKAQLGIEADQFLSTPLGRYLLERSETDVERLKEALVATDANDTTRNQQIRNKIYIARQFRDWITEVIAEGHMAYDELREREALE